MDNSNTQFALLALHEAERAGVPVKEQTWRLVQNYWRRTQNLDGSWGYMEATAGTGSMTCAGIAAMVIADDRLHRGDAEVQGDKVRCCGTQEQNPEIDRAGLAVGAFLRPQQSGRQLAPALLSLRAGMRWLG